MIDRNINEMKRKHQVLAERRYEPRPLNRGYTDRTLHVDVGKGTIDIRPVTDDMKRLWTGGKGFDLWLMFQHITPETKWDSPNNPICFSSGPLGGTASFPGSGKTLVTSISPTTHSIIDSNVGGYFGPYLKFAGFDALVITGKSDDEVIVFIDPREGRITLEKAPEEDVDSHLAAEEFTRMYADDEDDQRHVAVVSAGRAADHVLIGVLNFSFYDWRRKVPRLKQAGRGGIGTVFRNKKIKALIVRNHKFVPSWRIAETEVARQVKPRRIIRFDDRKHEIEAIADTWRNDPDFIIEMMQDIQEKQGCISKTAVDVLCDRTGVSKAEIYHIATFFSAFSLEPEGKHIIEVCTGTACHLKGSGLILDAFRRELGIESGETTPDGLFSIKRVACLGCCSLAPVVRVDGKILSGVKASDVPDIIRKTAAEDKTAGPDEDDRETRRVTIPGDTSPDRLAERVRRDRERFETRLTVCTCTACRAAGSFELLDRLASEVKARHLDHRILVTTSGCHGFYPAAPAVEVFPQNIFYRNVKPDDAAVVIESVIDGNAPVERLLFKDPATGTPVANPDKIDFFRKQLPVVMRNRRHIDPEDIGTALAEGTYRSLQQVLQDKTPDDVINDVLKSGLRGRGGGGFPAGVKWRSCKDAAQNRKAIPYVVCNADEGDPGAYMDRSILEANPHSVLEGMIIGGYAVGAREGFIYVRKEYPLALDRVEKAIAQAEALGLLGENILGNGFSFHITVHRGAGAFVAGESSALMASMAGRVAEPRAKYVHNVEYGYRNLPTVLNNVETWANVPVIMERGPDWFASIGTGTPEGIAGNPWSGSSGTKVFSLAGTIRNSGLVEVPMGVTLREIIYDIGGGIPGDRAFKAVQTGGPSGGCIPASMLDMPVDFDSLSKAGSMMGSGGMIVMDEKTCMVDVARYFTEFLMKESCGKCTPCREGVRTMYNILTRICEGNGRESDIAFLEELADTIRTSSLCQLGATAPNPFLTTLRYFREEYIAHIKEKRCPAGHCKALITYHIREDACTGCTVCAKHCPVNAISGEPKASHIIDQKTCIKCGVCYEVCNFDAVEVK